ncbi:MAG: hypothetical protein JSV12_03015 [Candidatus Bathyarchaeota archaeon]|nr:MAG: hypothetical protein JSV12_03015 [Candidatus Bathyarchaeota archaeon]
MVDPRIMCRQHLLGEHAEIHMLIETISRGNSVKGYLDKGLLEVHSLYNRHDELVKEMKRRNYRHYSAISKKWKQTNIMGSVNREKNLEQLINRCSRCREGYERISTKGK